MALLLVVLSSAVGMADEQPTDSNKKQHPAAARQHIRRGNRQFVKGNLTEAQVEYQKAYEADTLNPQAVYNKHRTSFPMEADGSHVKQMEGGMADSLAAQFVHAAMLEKNPLRQSMSFHNAGVAYQAASQFDKAVDCYKQALRLNPSDDEARYNYVLCKHQLKNGGGNGANNDQQKQDQEKQDQEKKDQEKQDQQDQQKQKQQQQEQKEPEPQEGMSKENAEQLLQDAMRQERQTQKRLKEAQKQPQRRVLQKNW